MLWGQEKKDMQIKEEVKKGNNAKKQNRGKKEMSVCRGKLERLEKV